MATLGRISADLNEERGPDVTFEVRVPSAWMQQGAELELSLPRLLPCARCEGGGCDACLRAGAFSRERLAAESPLSVHLPTHDAGERDVQLRLPGCGAKAEGLPPGHLLLTVRTGSEPSVAVSRRSASSVAPNAPRLVALALAAVAILWWWLSR